MEFNGAGEIIELVGELVDVVGVGLIVTASVIVGLRESERTSVS